MRRNEKQFIFLLVVPLLTLIVVAGGFALTGHLIWAWVIGTLGTLGWFLLLCTWIVLVDSKSRWPNDTAKERFYRIITLQPPD